MAALPLARQHARERRAPDADVCQRSPFCPADGLDGNDEQSQLRCSSEMLGDRRHQSLRYSANRLALTPLLLVHDGSRSAMPPRRPRALRLRLWRAASAPRRRRRARAARSGPCRPRRPPPPPPPARPRPPRARGARRSPRRSRRSNLALASAAPRPRWRCPAARTPRAGPGRAAAPYLRTTPSRYAGSVHALVHKCVYMPMRHCVWCRATRASPVCPSRRLAPRRLPLTKAQ